MIVLSELYCGNGIAMKLLFEHTDVRTNCASRTESLPKRKMLEYLKEVYAVLKAVPIGSAATQSYPFFIIAFPHQSEKIVGLK